MTEPAELDIDGLFEEAEAVLADPPPAAPEEDLVALALEAEDPLPYVQRMSEEQKTAFNARLDDLASEEEERHAIRAEPLAPAVERSPLIADPYGPQLLSPAELFALEVVPRDPLFILRGKGDTMLSERDYGMVFANRGTGKTMWIVSQAIALAAGTTHANMKAVAPRRVLLIDGEMPLVDMKGRIKSFLLSLTPEERDLAEQNFRLLSWEHNEDGIPNLAGTEGWDFVDRAIAACDPALVFLDNISCLAGSSAENDENAWSPIGTWSKGHRKERAFIWVHHASRGGTARGTSKREDTMDFVLHLKQPSGYSAEDGACFEASYPKSRGRTGAAVEPYVFRLNNDETDQGRVCTWSEVSREETAGKALAAKLERAIPIVRALLTLDPMIKNAKLRSSTREQFKEEYGAGISDAVIDQAARAARYE